jgi:hypothetical protein
MDSCVSLAGVTFRTDARLTNVHYAFSILLIHFTLHKASSEFTVCLFILLLASFGPTDLLKETAVIQFVIKYAYDH